MNTLLVMVFPTLLATASRDAGDGLAEQEDAERAYHAGQHEGRVGVLQTPVGEHLVLRDDGYGPWDHHGDQGDGEQ